MNWSQGDSSDRTRGQRLAGNPGLVRNRLRTMCHSVVYVQLTTRTGAGGEGMDSGNSRSPLPLSAWGLGMRAPMTECAVCQCWQGSGRNAGGKLHP